MIPSCPPRFRTVPPWHATYTGIVQSIDMGWNDVGDTYQGREKRWERVREPPGNMAPSGWVYINCMSVPGLSTSLVD